MFHLFIPTASLSFVAGCILAYDIAIPTVSAVMLIIAAAGTIFPVRKHGISVLICVCIIALLFGFLRVQYKEYGNITDWESIYSTEVEVGGIIRGDIEHLKSHSRYVIDTERITDENGAVLHPKENILVYEPYPTACVTGERVSMKLIPEEPEDFLTEANRIFRYKQHLKQQGIRAVAFTREHPCVGIAEEPDIFSILRKKFMEAVHSALPIQEASLLGGLLLGLRGSLSQELLDIFRVTGLLHIIVLSGYNITIVAEAVRRLCSRTPRAVSLGISLFTIIAFVLLAGAQTAAVRAGSMATIALIARMLRRENDGIRILLLVGALMVLYNPDQIVFSTSFHMSFLATLGLLIFSPIFERHLTFIPDTLQIRNITAATVATQIFLLPYLMYSIGEVSLVGIIANILVLPIVPIAMACGALLILITLIAPFITPFIAPFAYIPLAAIIHISDTLAVPYAAAPLPIISAPMMIIAVAALSAFGLWYRKKINPEEN